MSYSIFYGHFLGRRSGEVNKYPNRFKLLHLKDLRKGVKGDMSGKTATENDVALGEGQLESPRILKINQYLNNNVAVNACLSKFTFVVGAFDMGFHVINYIKPYFM